MPEMSLFRRMSRSPLNIEPSVDLAVKGRAGMLSAPGLGIVRYDVPVGLLFRLLVAVRARCQKARSLSRGCLGGSILMFLPSASAVVVARVGSMANVPILGPLPSFGVIGRGVFGVIGTLCVTALGKTGALGALSVGLPAARFRSSRRAICTSLDSSSVVSPSSSEASAWR